MPPITLLLDNNSSLKKKEEERKEEVKASINGGMKPMFSVGTQALRVVNSVLHQRAHQSMRAG